MTDNRPTHCDCPNRNGANPAVPEPFVPPNEHVAHSTIRDVSDCPGAVNEHLALAQRSDGVCCSGYLVGACGRYLIGAQAARDHRNSSRASCFSASVKAIRCPVWPCVVRFSATFAIRAAMDSFPVAMNSAGAAPYRRANSVLS